MTKTSLKVLIAFVANDTTKGGSQFAATPNDGLAGQGHAASGGARQGCQGCTSGSTSSGLHEREMAGDGWSFQLYLLSLSCQLQKVQDDERV